ncbi:hypothetical protein NUW58_g83 [Xylaria curta]|uniref:Uncharacterized protein n=1 Tax=Xylaria curta TaxID=42375 RepID=A0ACC1PQG3_9PEZI|nr:hypothetical protein NUW58_g83 [Xylaria curta]
MKLVALTLGALITPGFGLLRFPCAQLVIDRLDPLVSPGQIPSPHLHQIVGGSAVNSNRYFKARNGTYKRVPQVPNFGFDGVRGGMTVYYMQDGLYNYQQTSKVTSFQPGFRMFIGNVTARTREDMERYRQVTYTCLETDITRDPQILDFPSKPCRYGIMTALRFPTCWDGKNLDSPDHMAHMAYPEYGTFETGGACPDSHPVRMGQLFYEVNWDTTQFNNLEDWPEDGSQPFVWSFGDNTGYGNHADYVFGWQGNALQRALDQPCYINCNTLKTQSIAAMNACGIDRVVNEDIDGWTEELPGGFVSGM